MKIKTQEDIASAKEMADEMLRVMYHKIENLSEYTVPLYDVIEDFFFQDVDYQRLQPNLPMWMADAGRSAESPCNRVDYDSLRHTYNDPLSNRILHWFDVQNILAAFQDKVCALIPFLVDIFTEIPAYCLYKDLDYTDANRVINPRTDSIHTSINNVFVSLASAFDLFTKVVYECAKYDPNGFVSYNRLRSRKDGILYAKKNFGFEELKELGLLYDEPACIRTICSFRDEFIHCGSWDYRCAIYYPSIDGEPVEPFIPMPDVEPSGVLVCSGSRNKFYASGAKINTVLPPLVIDVVDVLAKTRDRLMEVLQGMTKPATVKEREKAAGEYVEVIIKNLVKLAGITSKKNKAKE